MVPRRIIISNSSGSSPCADPLGCGTGSRHRRDQSLLDKDQRDADEEDYLDVLGDLVEKYETSAHPIPPVSDADMLRHLIEAKGVTQAEVAEETGISRSTISEILSGKRTLNRRHIDALAGFFHVSPAVFLAKEPPGA